MLKGLKISDFFLTAGGVLSALGGWEFIKYLFNRKSNSRQAKATADQAQFGVLRDTIKFLQEQLLEKERRFAEQTELVRSLNKDKIELTGKVALLEAERSMKLCERRGCKDRQPQSGY